MLSYYIYFLKDVLSNSVFWLLQHDSQNQAFKMNYFITCVAQEFSEGRVEKSFKYFIGSPL